MVQGPLEIPLEKSGARGFQKKWGQRFAEKMGPEVFRKMGARVTPYTTVVSSNVLNFYCHSKCPCINVARLSVLYYDTIAHVVNIPGKS